MKPLHLCLLLSLLLESCSSAKIQTLTATPPMTKTPNATETPSATTIPNTPTPSAPIPNTIYLVDYKGQAGIFVTSKYLDNDTAKPQIPSAYKGNLIPEYEEYNIPGNFLDFRNPQKLITIMEDVAYLGGFIIEPNSHTLYLSVVIRRSDKSEYNPLYKINLDSLVSQVIWKKEIGDRPYNEYRGVARIIQVKEPYLELSIHRCFGCTPCPPHGALILNMETGIEKFLGAAGNIEINLNQNTFSYQLIAEDTECNTPSICPCDAEIAGPIYTETLP